MSQAKQWENEYRNPRLVTLDDKPQKDLLRYFRWLKRECGLDIAQLRVLDLGCGTGRNSNHLAGLGAKVCGVDISGTAIELAKKRALKLNLQVEYLCRSIGEPLPFPDRSFDLILDITSSNSLTTAEREVYLAESARLLAPGGHMLVRALCLEGDKNAKNLLQKFPAKEPGTYRIKELDLTEKVFDRHELIGLYSKHFQILDLMKKSSYTKFNGQSFKRNFWLLSLENPRKS